MSAQYEILLEPNRFRIITHLIQIGGSAKSASLRRQIGIKFRAGMVHHQRQLADAGLIAVHGKFIEVLPRGRRALADLAASIIKAAESKPATLLEAHVP